MFASCFDTAVAAERKSSYQGTLIAVIWLSVYDVAFQFIVDRLSILIQDAAQSYRRTVKIQIEMIFKLYPFRIGKIVILSCFLFLIFLLIHSFLPLHSPWIYPPQLECIIKKKIKILSILICTLCPNWFGK